MDKIEAIEKLYDNGKGILEFEEYLSLYEKAIDKGHKEKTITTDEYQKKLKYILVKKNDKTITKLTKEHHNEIKTLKRKHSKALKMYIKKSDFDEILNEEPKKKKEKKEKTEIINNWLLTGRGFKGVIERYKFVGKVLSEADDYGKNANLPMEYLASIKKDILELIKLKLENKKSLKFNIVINSEYHRISKDEKKKMLPYFASKQVTVTNKFFDEALDEQIEVLLSRCDAYEGMGSGWVIQRIVGSYINFAQYRPLKGSSWVDLPDEIKGTKAVLNIKNDDNKCFMWSVLAHLHPVAKNGGRVNNYKKFEDELKIKKFPVGIDQIPQIEKNNNININVFIYEKEVIPLYISKDPYNAIDLFLHDEHYTLIKDFDKLNYSYNKHKAKKHFCKKCMHCFCRKEILERHIPDCDLNNPTKTVLPAEGSKMEFQNFNRKLKVPYVIYADFECLTEELEAKDDQNVDKTVPYQKHKPCGFCLYVVSVDEKYNCEPILYRGPDADIKFLEVLYQLKKKLLNLIYEPKYKDVKDMIEMTDEEKKAHKDATHCHICEKEFEDGDDKKVRDHCHITGYYRGPAHNSCNVNFRFAKKIPVIFHNLKGYDAHFIIKNASKVANKIECLPLNKEKYISFTLDQYLFIDSLQFMNASLESLVGNLKKKGIEYFKHTMKFYSGEFLDLLTRKGVYPYDYMNTFKRFLKTKLPDIKDFFSKLSNSDISKEDYDHALNIWNKFNIKNMGEYHDLYLKSDVLLLADVFESFRNTCMNAYKLDPCHYYTAPGLSWDAMLFKTGIKLELISDIDIYNFIEKGIRGGISVITHRHAKANNKYMKDFDPTDIVSFITYLDANNLYGWAMIQLLAHGNFEWLDEAKIKKLMKVITNLDDSKKGYIFEVDIEYPNKLHDLHNDFPLLAENIAITNEMRSKYAMDIATGYEMKTDCKITKLCPNLMDKTKYVIHYRNLQQAIEMGLKVTKVHRVLQFDQSNWLKEYIDFNTQMRTKATNDFEKDFFKLMNNSVFGKTMENVRNHMDGKLVNDVDKLRKLINNPRYKGNPIFYDKDYCFVEMHKKEVKLNKPIYVGFCILELSKVLMYDFHYNYIKKEYGDKAQLLFQDTDSLTYHIKTEDLYQDFFDNKEHFDFSEMPKNCKEFKYFDDTKQKVVGKTFFDESNKKVIGKMKCEEGARIITEFVGLRSKMYSVKFDKEHHDLGKDPRVKPDKNEKKTAKGVKECVKKTISHEDYLDVLINKKRLKHTQNTIRSYNHEVYSIATEKITLSAYDDKRAIKSDGISSYAYGHHKLVRYCQYCGGEYNIDNIHDHEKECY